MSAAAPLETLVVTTGDSPRSSIIWLHGLGANYHDFESIVPEITSESMPPLRFVFPNAPVRPITINGGIPTRGWYDIAGLEMDQRQDAEGVRASAASIEELIAAEKEQGIEARNIFLAGFSQGGAIALHVGLRHPETLAGILALSTYLPLADTLAAEKTAAGIATPVFQAHGTYDPVVAFRLGKMTREWLEEAGATVSFHSYPMQHSLCLEEIEEIRSWLGNRLAS